MDRDNRINGGDIAEIIRSMVCFATLALYYTDIYPMVYPPLDAPVLFALARVVVNFVLYPFMAILIRHVIVCRPIPRNKALAATIPWCTVMWLLTVCYNSLLDTGWAMYYPIASVWINNAILTRGSRNPEENSEKAAKKEHPSLRGVVNKAQEKDVAGDVNEPSPGERAVNRMKQLARQYYDLKKMIESVDLDVIYSYFAAGKITEEEYTEIMAAYHRAEDEMRRIYREHSELKAGLAWTTQKKQG